MRLRQAEVRDFHSVMRSKDGRPVVGLKYLTPRGTSRHGLSLDNTLTPTQPPDFFFFFVSFIRHSLLNEGPI